MVFDGRLKRSWVCGLCFLVLAATVSSSGQEIPKTKAAPSNEKLRQELLRRMQEDQVARKRVMEYLEQHPGTDLDVLKKMDLPIINKMHEIDRRNTAWMKEIIDRHGWPGNTLVGKDGAQAAWLLVQHADLDLAFQKRCLPLITEAVKKGEASAGDMAYLNDRVRIAAKEKQIYGTQFRQVNGKWEPHPIEDEATVDKRRKEVGLPTLAEYRKFLEKMYQSKPGEKP